MSKSKKNILCLLTVIMMVSAVFAVTVAATDDGPVIVVQPENLSVGCNGPVSFSVTAYGDELSYKWFCYIGTSKPQEVEGYGSGLTLLPHEGSFHGVDGYTFYCEITDKNGNSVTTDHVDLTIDAEYYYVSLPSQHIKYCLDCGKEISREEHVPGPEATEENAQTCTVCGYELAPKLPHVHSYSEQYSFDGVNHWRECRCGDKIELEAHVPGPEATEENAQTCTVCGYELAAKLPHVHVFSEEYISTETSHWRECRCGEIIELMPHTPGPEATEYAAQTCTVCGYVLAPRLEHVHSYPDEYKSDSTGHWRECRCGNRIDVSVHFPGAVATEDSAQTCTVCGYELAPKLPHTHVFTGDYISDETGHWRLCKCGERSTVSAHEPGEPATEKNAQLCILCGYEIEPRIPHNHVFGTDYKSDANYHWFECECGENSGKEEHLFPTSATVTIKPTKDNDGEQVLVCSKCGYTQISSIPKLESNGGNGLIIFLCVGCVLAVAATTVVFVLRRRR